MPERIAGMSERMDHLEDDIKDMKQFMKTSVDDIKDTVRSQISELKSEQLGDLKTRLNDGYRQLNEHDLRLRDVEKQQNAYAAAGGVLGWLVKTTIGVLGVLAGAFGWEHFRH